MIPISVCIITKNEAAHLEKCLQALQPYPFEVVVTDTGSADDSVAVAKRYTDRVYEFAWCNDFSAAKNFCVDHASHNIILSLDTDEFIHPFVWETLQETIEKNPKGLGTIELFNYFDTDDGTKRYQVRLERLFNRRHYRFVNPVHEALAPIGRLTPYRYDTPISADHVGYQGSAEKLREKAERDISMLLAELSSNPEDPYLYFQLGQSYMLMRDEENALDCFLQGIEHNPDPGAEYTQVLVHNCGHLLLDRNRTDEASFLLSYYEYYSDRMDFLCLTGLYRLRQNQPLGALPEFVKALTAPKQGAADAREPSYYIGYIYELFGKTDIARTHYQNCGADYTPAREALARLDLPH